MRLVDADTLKKNIPPEEINARMALATAPTIDIVRCKDCVNFHKYGFKLEYTECKHFDCDVCEDGFCVWGERKENEE